MKIFSYRTILDLLLLSGILGVTGVSNEPKEDKLQIFYDRLKKSDVKYCADKTRLLPDCKVCIPGLEQKAGSSTCDQYVKESVDIRTEIGKLTGERYGEAMLKSSRPFGLYPCKYAMYSMICETYGRSPFSIRCV